MELTYLASPYSVYGADAAEKDRRFKIVCRVAAALMKKGENIFCPIAHSHPIEVYGMNGWIGDHDFWLKQDFAILEKCTLMKVLEIPGIDWHDSTGITREAKKANSLGIPVVFITEEEALRA